MNFQNNRTQRESVWWLTVLVVGSLIWLFGCSTMEHSVMLGAGSGLAAGTAGGLMFGGKHRTEATLICAGVGGVIGGLASYVIHGELEKRDDRIRRNTLFNLEYHGITRSSVGRADLSDISTLLASPEIEEDHGSRRK